MARIGSYGTDVYPLDPKPTVPALLQAKTDVAPAPKDTVFETEIVARTHGELFLYVNDAVLQLPFHPGSARWFYNNNHGSADVLIELVQAPSRIGENTAP